MDIVVRSFHQADVPAYMVAMNLATGLSIPIGFEGIPGDQKLVTVTVLNGTVRSILSQLVAADPRYEWRLSPDGIINILPKANTGQLLDLRVSKYAVRDLDRRQALDQLMKVSEVSGTLRAMGITERTPATRYTYQADGSIPKFTIALENVSMRTALNAITRASGSVFWSAQRYGLALQYLSVSIGGSASYGSGATK